MTNSLINAYGATSAKAPLSPLQIARRKPEPHDIEIAILYCGVCHTDIHMAHGEMPGSIFPMVPGHEIVGKVTATGTNVTFYQVGDTVAVGCFIDSCHVCQDCLDEQEQYCDQLTFTYNSLENDGCTPTYGGYAKSIVVHENYVLSVAPDQNLAAIAPLLCAGITPYSAYRHWGIKKGSRVGVIGLGGVGHLAVKIAVAMGANVTVFSSSASKRDDAIKLGASDYANSTEPSEFSNQPATFDMMFNTVSASLDFDAYINLLKRDGVFVMVAPSGPITIDSMGVVMKRRNITGSVIGSIKETQEMLDFCAANNVTSDIELISASQINEAYERILKNDVRYRFVIDMNTL